jgi:hypothetical protein
MKNLVYSTVVFVLVLAGICCKKESFLKGTGQGTSQQPNTAPFVYAGNDTTLLLPSNSVVLKGVATDAESNISSYEWHKTYGPSKYILSTPHLLETTVSDLESGIYVFELTVRDSGGLSAKSQVMVYVTEIVKSGSHQVAVFKNCTWIFPWYSSIEVANIFSLVSPTDSIKVFIQRDNNLVWIEVPKSNFDSDFQASYEYFIEKRPDGAGMYNFGSLYIFYYGNDTYDTPDIKIEY